MGTAVWALAGFAVSAVLGGRPPVSLEGRGRKWYLAAAAGVNLWIAACPEAGIGGVLLGNALLWMAATDLRERALYDLHFYVLLLGGAACAFFQGAGGFVGRGALFLALFAVLFLVSRRNPGLGMGDSRVIAGLALYFPFSGWMEVMLVSLGGAMLWGLWGVLRKKKTMKTELPFAPFLLAGALAEWMLRRGV